MTSDMDSVSGSPVSSAMSVSSVSTPGTPGSGQFTFMNSSASTGCMSDSMDSDMENNNFRGLISSGETMSSVTVKLELNDSENGLTTPKKKRYSKSRVRNRSPALVKKLKLTRRSKANDRERHRMHNLNDALDGLREILPNHGEENKLTKIETLRFAYNYIFALKEMVNMLDRGEAVDGEDNLFNAQMSAAAAVMKLEAPSASQTLSQLHQHQLQRQHQQQLLQQQHASTVTNRGPVSPTATSQHQQQFSPGMQVPHVPNSIEMSDVITRRCQEPQSMSTTGTTCYNTGSSPVIQVQNFVSNSISSQALNVATSTSPTGHVTGYRLCPPQFHWPGSLQNSHGFHFEHPHSPTGYSDTSDGYTFEMM